MGLFFAQLALAAYACRLVEASAVEQSAARAMPPQCEEMDGSHGQTKSVLCAEHCQAEPARLAGDPTPAPALAPPLPVLIRVLSAADALGGRWPDAVGPSGPPPPPLLALYGRLRI
ncbi:MAG TPA: hypothetical protein VM491_04480 [Burkholderiaceae bacterium]|nr:hypothetical protein [Burkholderiaceae bacterium]